METSFLPDDPRLCRQWVINCSRSGAAVFVVFLLGRTGSHVATAIHAMTPAEAREVALLLFDGAAQADRIMNEAVRVEEEKEGV